MIWWSETHFDILIITILCCNLKKIIGFLFDAKMRTTKFKEKNVVYICYAVRDVLIRGSNFNWWHLTNRSSSFLWSYRKRAKYLVGKNVIKDYILLFKIWDLNIMLSYKWYIHWSIELSITSKYVGLVLSITYIFLFSKYI